MSYITTFTGKHFDPLCIKEADIDLMDIFHALSLLCRGNGHVSYFFSVGQHSLNCAWEARARGYSSNVQLACLLHDASEAYMSDVPRPIKAKMKEYQNIEDDVLQSIWDTFLERPLTDEEYRQVFDIDDDMLAYEFYKLMPENLTDRYLDLVSVPDVSYKNPVEVKEAMFQMYKTIIKE